MLERFLDKIILNWNLHSSLERWKKNPDRKESVERMQKSMMDAMRGSFLSLSIKREILNHEDIRQCYVSSGLVRGNGREVGDLIIFETSDIRARVGEDAGREYLFLERGGTRVGFLRPEYIASIKIKE